MRLSAWILGSFLAPFSAFALYNGNPSLPMMPEMGVFISKNACFGVKVGYELDWVYDCDLHLDLHHFSKKQAHHYASLTQFGIATLNFNDRVELFANMGSLSCHWNHRLNSTHQISYVSNQNWAWGVGGRAILAYWGDLQLGVNASYVQSHPSLSSLKVNGQSYDHQRAKIDLNPWQIGAGVSYRFGWFLPYIGMDYINLSIEVEDLDSLAFLIPQEKTFFKNEQPLGLFFGMGVGPEEGFNLNVEARFINENGCSVSADFKF